MSNSDNSINDPYEYSHSSKACIQGSIISTWALAIIVCVLRFTARRMSMAGLWYDDWLILPGVLAACAMAYVSAVWMVEHGLEDPFTKIDYNSYNLVMLGTYVELICWTVGLTSLKCSILALYWRIFATVKRIRIAIWVLLGVTLCWGIATLILSIILIVPIFGDLVFDTFSFFISVSVSHIIIDAFLLFMSILLVWRSPTSGAQKMILCVIFAFGGFVIIISVFRLLCIYLFGHGMTSAANGVILTSVEVNISTVCACVPSLRPIYSYIADKWTNFRNHKGKHLRGNQLLVDMIPRRHRKNQPSFLPVSQIRSTHSIRNEKGQTPPTVETEANEQPLPECEGVDAEIREMQSKEVAAGELGSSSSRRPTATSNMLPGVFEMQADEVAAKGQDWGISPISAAQEGPSSK